MHLQFRKKHNKTLIAFHFDLSRFAHLLTKLTKNLITRPILETPIKSSKFLTTSYEYSYYESANNYVGDSVNDAKAVVVFAATIGK